MVTTYIIGGAPRSGKSLVAKYLLEKYFIPGFTTDLLREAISYSIPSFGIRSEDMKQPDKERSHILWPYFKGLIKERSYYDDKLVIEGTNFLPSLINEIKELSYIKICFLGFPNSSVEEKFKQIKLSAETEKSWTDKMTDRELNDLIKNLIGISKDFEKECDKFDFKFFDTSHNFEDNISKIGEYIIS